MPRGPAEGWGRPWGSLGCTRSERFRGGTPWPGGVCGVALPIPGHRICQVSAGGWGRCQVAALRSVLLRFRLPKKPCPRG